MHLTLDCLSLPLIFAYAETHFRFFNWQPSLLFRRLPEIVFDLPRRVAPGQNLPVMLLVNDIDRFPVEILSVSIVVKQPETPALVLTFDKPQDYQIRHPFNFQSAVFCFFIDRQKLQTGAAFINALVKVKKKQKIHEILNNNFPGASHSSLSVEISDHALPAASFASYGDLHIHSQFSQSQVEFGPPIAMISCMAQTSGLDFIAITDHSYDLCCSMQNYLQIDPALPRWQAYIKEVNRQNLKITNEPRVKPVVISGEEISCKNYRKKAVHLCALNIDNYIKGSFDGARRNTAKDSTLTIDACVDEIHTQKGLAIAAHPGSAFGFFQRILLNRDSWHATDLTDLKIDALQILNGQLSRTWLLSKRLWINELLAGKKVPIVAGNDSHGDFNRGIFIRKPFISIGERTDYFLSYQKTGIYGKIKNKGDVLEAIFRGKTFVTSGPFISINKSTTLEDSLISSFETNINNADLFLIIKSTYEFGEITSYSVFLGMPGEKNEQCFVNKKITPKTFELAESITKPDIPEERKAYLRAEVFCSSTNGLVRFAATSPCYFYG